MSRTKHVPDTKTKASSAKELALPIEVSSYNEIATRAQLVDVGLLNSQFRVDAKYFSKRLRKSKEAADQDFEIASEVCDRHFDPESGIAGVVFEWTIRVKNADVTSLGLVCQFAVVFKGLAGMQEREVEFFAERVGRNAAYPYFRSYVSQLSWLSGADLPLLPILRDPHVRRKNPGSDTGKKRRSSSTNQSR